MYKITYIPDGITILGQSFIAERAAAGATHMLLTWDELSIDHGWQMADYCTTPIFFRTQDDVPEVFNMIVGSGNQGPLADSFVIEEDKVFIVSADIAHSGHVAPIAFSDSPRLMFESGFADSYFCESHSVENIPNTVFRNDPERLPCNIPFTEDSMLTFEGWAIDQGLTLYKPGETCNSVNGMTIIAQAVWRDKGTGEVFLPKGTYYFYSDEISDYLNGILIDMNNANFDGIDNVYPLLMFPDLSYQAGLDYYSYSTNRIANIEFIDGGLRFYSVNGDIFEYPNYDLSPCLYLPAATRVSTEVFEIFSQICSYYPPYNYLGADSEFMPCSTISGCWSIPYSIISDPDVLRQCGANEVVNFSIYSEEYGHNYFKNINIGSASGSSFLEVATGSGAVVPIVDAGGWIDSGYLANDCLNIDFGEVPQAVSPLFYYWLCGVAEFMSNTTSQGSVITVNATSNGNYITVNSDVPRMAPDSEIYYQVYINDQLLNETWWAPLGSEETVSFEYNVCELPLPPYAASGRIAVVAAIPYYDDLFCIPRYQLFISANSGSSTFRLARTPLRDVPAPGLILYDDILHVATDDRMSKVNIYVNDTEVVTSSKNINYSLTELGINPTADVYEVYADATAYTPYSFVESQSNIITLGDVPITVDISRSKNYVILDTLNKFCTKNIKLRLVNTSSSATTRTVDNPVIVKLLRNSDGLTLKTKDTLCENYIKVELIDPPFTTGPN